MRRNRFWFTAVVAVGLLAMAGLAFGQAKSGNIYGRVVDDDGNALPGVTVTMSGHGAAQVFTTDSRGEFRFLNLDPGSDYNLKFDLENFATVERKGVSVNTGVNTDIRVGMKLAKVEASVTVTGETPLLDTRKVGTGAVITRTEMDSIPTARDPWVVIQTVPGVQIDRMNVGGSQSGQQSLFVAKGSQTTQGAWNLDGVNVSDLGSGNSSPTYWDFDAFQEIQAVTGGNDPSVAAAGVTINLVTKRGTNDVHGTARVFITDQHFQADPDLTAEMERQRDAAGGTAAFTGNRISGIQDYGAEVGGPILRDRVWLWGAYARQQIDLLQVNGLFDKTTLEDVNAKLNVQVLDSNSLTAYFLRGDKIKLGRNAGPTRPQPTTFDQSGPSSLYKVEDSHVFSPNFFANVQYSYFDEAFQLVAEGGTAPQALQDSNAVWQRSFSSSYFRRPQHQVLASTSLFFNTGSLGHELKLGGNYRIGSVGNKASWPGGGVIGFELGSGACSVACAAITRDVNRKVAMEYVGAYLSDTIKADRLTINAGARYDWATGHVRSSSVSGSALFPEILPAVEAPALNDVITWENVSPRVGLTYAIGKERKTLARASYARYVNSFGSYPVNQFSGIPGLAYAYYPWTDNGNRVVDSGELDLTTSIRTIGFNPADPGRNVSVNGVDDDLSGLETDEVVVGIDHEIMPNFAVGLAYTHRHYDNYYHSVRFDLATGRILTPDDYVLNHYNEGTLPDGTPFSAPVYSIIGGRSAVPPGFFFTNRPNYSEDFNGAELTLTKRLSNGWMARASAAWNDTTQNVGRGACVDPTNTQYSSGEDYVPGGCEDGGIVAPNAGSGSGSFLQVNLNSRWQFNVSGLYQLPLGFNVAANYFVREGYPIAYYVIDTGPPANNPVPTDGLQRRVYVTDIDAFRYGSVDQLDLRLDKAIGITSTVSMTLSAEVFNVMNRNTVLQRNARLKQTSLVTGTNTVFEMQSPRVLRFGARVSF